MGFETTSEINMRFDKAIARCAHVVDRSLRKSFPDDFDARCLYAALGMHRLAARMGYSSNMVGGDFSALAVAVDNSQASFQGYSLSDGDGEYAHYWCEIEGHIVDLGPTYLSERSRFAAVRAPIVMWPTAISLPESLKYRPKIRYAPDGEHRMAPEIMDRIDKFFQICDKKFASLSGQPKATNWLASGPKSIVAASDRGDLWALGTQHITSMQT